MISLAPHLSPADALKESFLGFVVSALIAVSPQIPFYHYRAPTMLVALLLGVALNFQSEEGMRISVGLRPELGTPCRRVSHRRRYPYNRLHAIGQQDRGP